MFTFLVILHQRSDCEKMFTEAVAKQTRDKNWMLEDPWSLTSYFNPIPTSQGRNQPLYELHMTESGRNRVEYLPTYLPDE